MLIFRGEPDALVYLCGRKALTDLFPGQTRERTRNYGWCPVPAGPVSFPFTGTAVGPRLMGYQTADGHSCQDFSLGSSRRTRQSLSGGPAWFSEEMAEFKI